MESERGVWVTLLLLAYVSVSLAQCPEGWTSAGFHCYKAFDEPQTWKQAESHCQSFNDKENKAHLTSVSGIGENVLLKSWLELTAKNASEYWLGLHPVDDVEGVLDDKWTDEGHADLTVWEEEGILEEEFMFMTKMCLVLNTAEGIWLPTDCAKSRPYVCKLSTCPRGWVAREGRCYHAFNARKQWVHAEKHCRSFAKNSEAHLVGIADAMENRFLLTLSEDKPEPFWIGMKGVNADGVTSTWSEDANFDLAGVDTKGATNKTGTCVEMHADDEITWKDSPCTHKRPYVCQLSHCRRGWTPIEGTCVWYTSEPKERKPSPSAAKGHKRVRRAGGRFRGRSFRTGGGMRFGGFKKFGSTRKVVKTQMTAVEALPVQQLGAIEPSKEVSNTPGTGLCMGGWQKTKVNGVEVCMRKWPLSMPYDEAEKKCESFTYAGDDKTAKGSIADAEFKQQSFTCYMQTVKKLRLI